MRPTRRYFDLATILFTTCAAWGQEVVPLIAGGAGVAKGDVATTDDYIIVGRHVFDIHTAKEVLRIDGAFSSKRMAASDDNRAALWFFGDIRVIDLDTGSWTAFQLPPEDPYPLSIAMNGPYLAYGHHKDGQDGRTGRVYVYDADSGALLMEVHADDSTINDRFGHSIAIEDDLLLVGAPLAKTVGQESGAVYVFHLPTGELLQKLVPPEAGSFAWFGHSVAISNGIMVGGAPREGAAAVGSGSAYVFDARSGQYLHQLFPANGEDQRWGGYAVDIDGPWILYSGGGWGPQNSATVHLFSAMTGRELQVAGRVGVHESSAFGRDVALCEDSLVVASPSQSPQPNAYLIKPDWKVGPTATRAYHALHPTDWRVAKKRAQALGGNLTSIASQAENDWLRHTFPAPDPVWIGYTDKNQEGSFVWVDGEAVTYENWAPNQPDDLGGQDFAALSVDGTWADEAPEPHRAGVVMVESTDCDGDGRPDAYEIEVDPGRDWNGDGTLDRCSPATYCGPANANSTGGPAKIGAGGSPDFGLNYFHLLARGVPRNELGVFLLSTGTDFVPLFGGGQGNLCLASPLTTLPPINTGAGSVRQDIDLTGLVSSGDTRHFQLWFRDGPTSNLTDAITVRFR